MIRTLAAVLAILLSVACTNPSSSTPSSPQAPAASSDASLSSLTVSSGTLIPAFTPEQRKYYVYLGTAPSSFTVVPISSANGATSRIDAPSSIPSSGTARYYIYVDEPDKTTREYEVELVIDHDYFDLYSPYSGPLTTSPVLVNGVWFKTKPANASVSISEATAANIVFFDDNTWTATVDTSAVANGPDKTVRLKTQNDSGTSSFESTYFGYTYSGSPTIKGYHVAGAVSFPDGLTLSSNDDLQLYVRKDSLSGAILCSQWPWDPFSGATSSPSSQYLYRYTFSGVVAGTVFVKAHYYNATNRKSYSATATMAIGTADITANLVLVPESTNAPSNLVIGEARSQTMERNRRY